MTLGFWAYHNECTGDVEDKLLPQSGDSPETSVQIFTVQGCPEGAEVVLYAIIGGGHNWSGVPDRISEQIAGNVNLDIEASEVIWEFFSNYTLDGGLIAAEAEE
jgi:polyhydroxybutyrate depolymerase